MMRFVSRYVFYGWIVVALGSLAQMITSLSMQGLSTYVEPLRAEFGWNNSQTAAGRSFQQVDSFLGPVNGWLLDRFGPRRLMTAGVLIYVAAFAVFSQVQSLLGFYGACLMMALANSLVGLLAVSVAVNHWFRRRRTTAMGLAVMGFALSGITLLPLLVWAQVNFGWRAAALGSAVAVLVIGLPIMILMRDAPEPHGLKPDDQQDGQGESAAPRGGGLVHFTVRQALRTRSYWLITGAFALAMLVQSAMVVHQFPQLERIVDRDTAAFVLAELNAFNMLGRLFGGLLGDRYAKNTLLGFNLIATALALVVLAAADTMAMLLVYGALFGFGWGMRTAVVNSLLGDYFGRAAFGKIVGVTSTLASPFAIAAPVFVGLGVDRLGGYYVPLLLLAVVALCSSALFLVALRPGDPA
jgi:sugar phosphate permease